MTLDDAVDQIKSLLGDQLMNLQRPRENRVYVEVDSRHIREITRVLYNGLDARLQTASGIDAPGEIEIVYHWAVDRLGLVVSVRTRIDRDRPEIASLTTVCPSAEWIEREMWELLGISFQDHPDLRHLLLADDWPEGKYPLRRDYRKE